MRKVLELFNMADWAFLRRGFEVHVEMYEDHRGKVFMFDQFSKRWMETNVREHCVNLPIDKIWRTRKCRTEDYN